ncbi:hypothetical protein AcV5_004860 [Taiwanofungus camphoratus]|nr:hypothetical protein AcV5_004860 [Antrodia cinnamomea]KAI0936814.1 hypothetical protein AcV5_004860 [Antrodia cinnamomea]
MDSFMNLAKEGFEAYERSQSNVSKTGGQEYNSPHHSGGGGQQQYGRPQFNHDDVINTASQQGSGESSMYSSAIGYVQHNTAEHEQPIDEQHVQDAHRQAYQEGNSGNLSAGSMGSAAAMQVLKKFTSGSGGGSGSQSDLISFAMAEASKLFDQSGGAASGNKQDAINGAAMTVMKLLVQSKSSGTVGGSNSGGLGGLMGLASKFM